MNLTTRRKINAELKKENKKLCNNCEIIKDLTQFNKSNDSRYTYECFRSICKDCESKYKRERRDHRIAELKKNLSCSVCGYNKCLAALDFHHTNPSEKEYEISQMFKKGMNIERIKEEIEKCVVLCANCHRELHWNEKQNNVE